MAFGMLPPGRRNGRGIEALDDRGLAALLAAASSDRRAFERLYELTHRRIHGLCFAIVLDDDVAEDATLDAYTQIWRQAGTFDPLHGSVWTWLFSIARARALDHARARRADALRRAAMLPDRRRGPDPL